MGIASPRILVVDDKVEHGETIVRKLWSMGYAGLYVNYEQLVDGDYGSFQGVRLIFMDLDLKGREWLGDGADACGDVEAVIRKILKKDNGPWALVTWTGHADHAEQLWVHLQERLPFELKPLSHQVMKKEDFLGEGKDEQLAEELKRVIAHQDAVKCLLNWESGVLDSANEVIAELVKVAVTLDGNSTENLGALLYELAKAESGKTIAQQTDLSQPLYRVLTSLLSDRLGSTTNEGNRGCAGDYIKEKTGADLTEWKQRINVMLNLEIGELDSTCPGAIFEIQESTVLPHPLDQEKLEILEKEFFYPNGAQNDEQRERLKQCALFLIDFSPPCDHSQQKIRWRRFVVAAKVPVSVLSNSLRNKLKNKEYIRITPEFTEDSGSAYLIILNANLQVTLRDSEIQQHLGEPVARLKEQILSDYLGWFGRHITRLGHVWLSTP